jgi:hypothetical protein
MTTFFQDIWQLFASQFDEWQGIFNESETKKVHKFLSGLLALALTWLNVDVPRFFRL